MNNIVIFYSYSGNTAEVAKTLADELSKQGSTDIIRLEAQDESESFIGQCKRALFKKR